MRAWSMTRTGRARAPGREEGVAGGHRLPVCVCAAPVHLLFAPRMAGLANGKAGLYAFVCGRAAASSERLRCCQVPHAAGGGLRPSTPRASPTCIQGCDAPHTHPRTTWRRRVTAAFGGLLLACRFHGEFDSEDEDEDDDDDDDDGGEDDDDDDDMDGIDETSSD